MKNQKYILSALAALSVLTAATSVTAFAGEETAIPENNAPEIITEAAEIPEAAVDSDAEAEEITELDAETIADAEIEEDAEAETETITDAEIKEENHKHYGFRKWNCEDWCNFAGWLGGAGWRCGRDQMPDITEEAENTAVQEDAEIEAEAETTYIQEWYDNHFDWNHFDENSEEAPEGTDEQLSEDDSQEEFDYWKWDCWYVQDENADKTDYECKEWYDFDWSECETFTDEDEQPSELTEEDTEAETEEQEAEEAEKEFTAPKHEHKKWHNFRNKTEKSASEEEELTEEDTEAEKEFTAPKHEYKNWLVFWDETEESAPEEEEQPSELTEKDTEETSFVDWMFDEYFKNKHFKNTEDEIPAEDADEETAELTEEAEKTVSVLDVQ